MKRVPFFFLIPLFMSCNSSLKKVDLLVTNAQIYTCDSSFSVVQAIAVKDGKIVEAGSTDELTKKYSADTTIDGTGKFIYPGFIDAHAHFLSYGLTLEEVDLTGAKSWDEVVDRVRKFAESHPEGWITGRGWDQNHWPDASFPDNTLLNEYFPDRPVLLDRVDGHAAIANQKAFELAGVQPGVEMEGGTAEVKHGKLTGILIDNAINLVQSKIPAASAEKLRTALSKAEANCFAQGLTTIHDCGLSHKTVELIDKMQQEGNLKMRLYVMLSDAAANYDWLFKNGILKTDRLNVRSFKVFSDGALGSRGACLLAPYADQPGWKGFLLSAPQYFDSIASRILEHGMQMCTHAIGDSGNRTMLHIYGRHLKGKNDKRWRIEHAQVVHPDDFRLFGDYNIIPSVQPTHATSDMGWAGKRLGPERVKGAYAFKELLDQNGWIPLGTDFPVEDISPFKTFYAAVIRKDADGQPQTGFQMENALTREETLKGMTIWAARSAFEEKEKGSLEPGKFADFIILDRDLMTVAEQDILHTRVEMTFVNGERVYERK